MQHVVHGDVALGQEPLQQLGHDADRDRHAEDLAVLPEFADRPTWPRREHPNQRKGEYREHRTVPRVLDDALPQEIVGQ